MVNDDYRIEKSRLPIVLTTMGGDRIVGELFVQTSARSRVGLEDAPEIMSAPDPFFPVVTSDGTTLLLAKDRVRELHVAREDTDPEQWQLGSPVDVEVALSGGPVYRGTLMIESMSGRSRLLDYLNRYDERFLTLHVEGGLVLLNRGLIEHVRPLN
jgi:hypothetical protein